MNDMQQEIDLLELGPQVARCLKGENRPGGEKVVSGRAYRQMLAKRRQEFYRQWGGGTPWTGGKRHVVDIVAAEKDRLRTGTGG